MQHTGIECFLASFRYYQMQNWESFGGFRPLDLYQGSAVGDSISCLQHDKFNFHKLLYGKFLRKPHNKMRDYDFSNYTKAGKRGKQKQAETGGGHKVSHTPSIEMSSPSLWFQTNSPLLQIKTILNRQSKPGGTFTCNYLNYPIAFSSTSTQGNRINRCHTNDFQQKPCTWAEGDR